ncbi:hypothetical protein [Pyxidicoccus sp. MSG2]|nr:hypothetical protein [Pyxidicoccus sp. MSG2]MCY1021520.1 hypothetical protein [Pyxidicoccus sp. MSG2]
MTLRQRVLDEDNSRSPPRATGIDGGTHPGGATVPLPDARDYA